ncbi:hypothetical protein FRB96_006053 [Tulasnella sp. 330]|nr:hypothetical protein FRB96_006053 [Tulasnella sp. 330]
MSDKEYKPATGVYLLRNAATKTMVDLINGGDHNPPNAVQGYEKVETESFRNQYWYTLNCGDADKPNCYYIINIRTNRYLTTVEESSNVTVASPNGTSAQQWLFWQGKSDLCRIQNLALRDDNDAKGYLKLASNSADNFIQVKVDLKDDNLTQQWRVICRTRSTEEVAAIAAKSAPNLLQHATGLIPPKSFLQMPNIMYQIIQGKYTDSGDIIKQGKAQFDKTQIFAFKHCVDKWANANLQVTAFQILAGLAFGQQEGAAKTAVWGLRDDDLTSIAYFDLSKGQIQNNDPKFAPSNTFF